MNTVLNVQCFAQGFSYVLTIELNETVKGTKFLLKFVQHQAHYNLSCSCVDGYTYNADINKTKHLVSASAKRT